MTIRLIRKISLPRIDMPLPALFHHPRREDIRRMINAPLVAFEYDIEAPRYLMNGKRGAEVERGAFLWLHRVRCQLAEHISSLKLQPKLRIHAEALTLWDESIAAHRAIVTANLGLAYKAAASIKSDEDIDDRKSGAVLGLMRAVDIFDVSRGIKFSTYAWQATRNTVRRLAVGPGPSGSAPELLAGSPVVDAAEVAELLAVADDRSRSVIERHYGFSGPAQTFGEIADSDGITRQRANQLAKRGIKTIREAVA